MHSQPSDGTRRPLRRSPAGSYGHASAIAEATSQRAYESEHARLQAELLTLLPDSADAAEPQYHRALAVARQQGAKWLELRAARAYAHYLLKQGRSQEARAVLAPVHAWFTEGFDTLDYLYADGIVEDVGVGRVFGVLTSREVRFT